MNEDKKNINLNEQDFIRSLPKIEITYSKSKDQVWEELMKATSKPHSRKITMRWTRYVAAACFILLLSTGLFINLYTTSVYCPKGEHLSVVLPDQSVVELNANSSLSYKPYRWKFFRKVKFKGEGFFKISKGSKFEIESEYGKTYILGTSFNIYARGNEYKVTCYTGKVKVVSTMTSDKILLLPNDHAYVTENGKFKLIKPEDVNANISWRNNLFYFTNTPVKSVFDEIELQYDIKIVEKGKFDLFYTGNFSKGKSVEKVLHTVCKPMNLNYKKGPNNKFIITSIDPR